LPFPLLCANADVGLPATAIFPTNAGKVGFVGLTHPAAHTMSSYGPVPDPDLTSVVLRACRQLREEGAVAVVALLHEGVKWQVSGSGGHITFIHSMAALCRPWLRAVDAVVAGHTLGRWIGRLGGVPVVQPWAFGAEVGVIELAPGGRSAAYGVMAGPDGRWTGTGGDLIAEAEATVIGRLHAPFYLRPNGPSPLADLFANALRAVTGAEAAAVPLVGTHQPPLDGILSLLPAGPVSEAELLRVLPWTDDSTVMGELTTRELEVLVSHDFRDLYSAWGFDLRTPAAGRLVRVAVPKNFAARRVEEAVKRKVEWEDAGHGLRSAVRELFHSRANPRSLRGSYLHRSVAPPVG